MPDNKEEALIEQIIGTGKRLYESGLAVARSGNLSARADGDNILITATGTYLGGLKPEDIVKVESSYTGQYLKNVLRNSRRTGGSKDKNL